MEGSAQADLFHRMAQPSFYPHAPASVTVSDTHISRVFLTGKYAYKVKKAVALPFLDFRSLAHRRHYCEAEVALNRRLAADTYLGTVPIYRGQGLGSDGDANTDPMTSQAPDGPVIEYAVQMRQLDPQTSLGHHLRHDGVDKQVVQRLAASLADFHAAARRDDAVTALGAWERVGTHIQDNFRDAAGAVRPLSRDPRFRAIAAVSGAYWRRHQPRFRRREAAGRICEGHGDLRCEHVYLGPSLQIIDCIEFSADLRCGDVAADLGFLLMDMDRHGAADLANHLLADYASRSNDPEIYALIDFYKCYRAMVRVKVNCLQRSTAAMGTHAAQRLDRATEGLLDRAYDYARRLNRPILFATSGLPASGKSTLARQLAEVFGIPVYRSDAVRKALFGIPAEHSMTSAHEAGIYRPAVTKRTYARLLKEAHRHLRLGESLILDAMYARRGQRRSLLELARQSRCGLVIIHCSGSRTALKARLGLRRAGEQVSDARLSHLEALEAIFEPLDDLPPDIVVPVNTEASVRSNLLTILAHTHTRPWRGTVFGQRV